MEKNICRYCQKEFNENELEKIEVLGAKITGNHVEDFYNILVCKECKKKYHPNYK